ncbi:Embryonic stem cell-specific 5-hydroxymethylcytosine-binding protein [Melia azedarach]|uniref:Embryonic stem cell-specific 5-hydroxymethylcytosine-binding protein n=1 Tax=Melia azedarach TaxID=155640 RepID=A0ACC1Z175_MELAZ|nr:Embryonic stem cell-specific 5-hydroxymethylcytosine-binding protein [Melia azedarach]
MCGRARCTLRADDVPRACHRTGSPVRTINMDRYRPSYNVAPGSNLPVIRRSGGSDGGDGFVLHCMKWGLIPSFTKKTEKPDFYKMFNARSESIFEKASFRRLLPKSRCLVAVEGFYEWKKDGSKKQPYYIHFKDGRPLVFAALYDSWQSSEGEVLYTFTILTTSSSSALQWLHDRMPVILGDKESTDAWLNTSASSKYDMILKPYEESDLVWYPVTPAMGKPSFDGPECIKEIRVKTEGNNPISNFFLKKDVKREQALNITEERSSFNESVKTNWPEDMKEEPEPMKEIKEEESSVGEKWPSDKTDRTILPKGVKEEPGTADDIRSQSSEEKGDHDAKSITSILPNEKTTKQLHKRDYEEFLADSNPATDKTDKLGTSPLKRKGNLKDAGDKQPTLFSYFSKK